MPNNPYERLDEAAAKVRLYDGASRIWSQRKAELPAIAEVIDQKLKENHFFGVSVEPKTRKRHESRRPDGAMQPLSLDGLDLTGGTFPWRND